MIRGTSLAAGLGTAALVLAGCGVELDAGDTVTETFAIDDFDELDIDGAFEVIVAVGQESTLEIDVGENLVDDLRVDQDGDRLRIGLDDGWFNINSDLEARLTTTNLSRLDLDGAVDADLRNLDSDRLELDLDGASRVDGEGSVRELVIDANGASQVDFGQVAVDHVELEANGASDLDLTGAAEVTGQLNGASSVDVSEEAQVNVRTEGASSIR